MNNPSARPLFSRVAEQIYTSGTILSSIKLPAEEREKMIQARNESHL